MAFAFNPLTGNLDYYQPSAGGGITIGTTTITSGTNTRILYNNAGVVGEYTLTGTGTIVVMKTAPTILTTMTLSRDSIGATPTDGIIIVNSTAAAAGAQQYSGSVRWTGAGWKTTATAASQVVDWISYNQPIQSTTNPSTALVFSAQTNAGGYNRLVDFTFGAAYASSSTKFIRLFDTFTDTDNYCALHSGVTSTSNFVIAPDRIVSGTPGGGTTFLKICFQRLSGNGGFISTDASSNGVTVGNLTTVNFWFNVGTGFYLSGSQFIGWTGAAGAVSAPDLQIQRSAAATLQMGADVNGAAVSQQLQAANGITGTDKTGGNLTLASGKGTGAGAVSSLIFQTPTVLGSGTTAQSLATRLTLSSAGATFAGSITTIGGATFHTTSSALTDGAGASAGTITNAPSVGNPTKWIGINDNGTTRYIPAW